MLRKSHSFRGKSVNVRSLNQRLSETAQFAVAKVIGKDKDHIWLAFIRCGWNNRDDRQSKSEH